MEQVPLEMDDIFGDQLHEDEEQMPEMLPDLPENGLESEIQGTQNDEEAGDFSLPIYFVINFVCESKFLLSEYMIMIHVTMWFAF